MMDVRIPPQDLDAEKSLVGALMLDPSRLDEISAHADDFWRDEYRIVFEAISEMYTSGRSGIDAVSIAHYLASRQQLAELGGPEVLGDLMDVVPHSAHAKHYADIVREKAQQRRVINACRNAIDSAYDENWENVTTDLESNLLALRESDSQGDFVSMDDAVHQLEQREQNPATVRSTGLVDLDRQIRGGLRDSQLAIIGGRPGSGKSVLASQIAEAFASRNEPSLIISIEMPAWELAERFDASIRRETLRRLPIQIVDSAFQADRIAALIRLAKRKHGIHLAVLDYLQLTESADKSAARERQVAEVSRTMKRLSLELRIPIIAACQLNRSSDKEGRLPRLSDLRESGSIEQDADIVLLLHQDEDSAKCIVAKHRNGSTGVVPLTFRGEQFRFENHVHYDGKL